MPQLDFITYSFQAFWLFVFFIFLCFFISFRFIIIFTKIIKLRVYKINFLQKTIQTCLFDKNFDNETFIKQFFYSYRSFLYFFPISFDTALFKKRFLVLNIVLTVFLLRESGRVV